MNLKRFKQILQSYCREDEYKRKITDPYFEQLLEYLDTECRKVKNLVLR